MTEQFPVGARFPTRDPGKQFSNKKSPLSPEAF